MVGLWVDEGASRELLVVQPWLACVREGEKGEFTHLFCVEVLVIDLAEFFGICG